MKGQWVKEWREVESWSLADLAERTGLAIAELQAFEEGAMPLDAKTAHRIRYAINQARRERASRLVDRLCGPNSQRRLERLLGLSQGYLSRLRSKAANPSPTLIATLALLANDTSRITELEPKNEQRTPAASPPDRDKIVQAIASLTAGKPCHGGR